MNQKIMRFACFLPLCFFLSVPLSSFSSVEKENVELSRISSVLNSVYPMINEAQKQSTPSESLHFQYEWLRSDIRAIQKGIAQKVNAVNLNPREIMPIKSHFSDSEVSS